MTTMAAAPIDYRKMFQEACADFAECIVIPNSWLPPAYHQHKEHDLVDLPTDKHGPWESPDDAFHSEQVFGRTVGEIERLHAEFCQPVIDADYIKAEKARRVELYAQQFEETGEITYEPPISQEFSKLADLLP